MDDGLNSGNKTNAENTAGLKSQSCYRKGYAPVGLCEYLKAGDLAAGEQGSVSPIKSVGGMAIPEGIYIIPTTPINSRRSH